MRLQIVADSNYTAIRGVEETAARIDEAIALAGESFKSDLAMTIEPEVVIYESDEAQANSLLPDRTSPAWAGDHYVFRDALPELYNFHFLDVSSCRQGLVTPDQRGIEDAPARTNEVGCLATIWLTGDQLGASAVDFEVIGPRDFAGNLCTIPGLAAISDPDGVQDALFGIRLARTYAEILGARPSANTTDCTIDTNSILSDDPTINSLTDCAKLDIAEINGIDPVATCFINEQAIANEIATLYGIGSAVGVLMVGNITYNLYLVWKRNRIIKQAAENDNAKLGRTKSGVLYRKTMDTGAEDFAAQLEKEGEKYKAEMEAKKKADGGGDKAAAAGGRGRGARPGSASRARNGSQQRPGSKGRRPTDPGAGGRGGAPQRRTSAGRRAQEQAGGAGGNRPQRPRQGSRGRPSNPPPPSYNTIVSYEDAEEENAGSAAAFLKKQDKD